MAFAPHRRARRTTALDAPNPAIARDIEAVARVAAVPAILEVVARTTGMRFSAVARVTETTWTACAVYDTIDFGLRPGGELALETTICNEIRQHRQPVVFGQATAHPTFATHPTPKLYGFESYVSIPIVTRDGEFFGTLCAIDPLPAKLDDPSVLRTLELFAQVIGQQLQTEQRLEHTQTALTEALDASTLREEFLAVVGHDLRSPLQAIRIGTETLRTTPLDARAGRVVTLIERSVERMGSLIEDIMDFARGRLGGGIPIALDAGDGLQALLEGVVGEVRTAHAGRVIESRLHLSRPIACDAARIAQLLANLLNNAVAHGAPDEPIHVEAHTSADTLELSVSNAGPPIHADVRALLFQPFSRPRADKPRDGLGLGLYIAAQIAKAHHGTLTVTSTESAGTRFTLRMPLH